MVGLLVLLIGLLAIGYIVGGLLIPREKTFTQETEINASKETVWRVLNDREKYPEWQDKLEKVEVRDESNWTEVAQDAGPIEFTVVRKDEPNSLHLKYILGATIKGEWLGELESSAGGKTIITTTDRSIVESWSTKILMSMFFDIEDFARDWNQKLKKRAEKIESEKTKTEVEQ